MTNLEFIEKEIKDIKNVLDEELDDENALFIHSLIEEDYISRLNDELQQLEQIKTKLEAWESIKPYIKIINDKQLWFEMIWFPTKEEKEQYANAVKNVKKALGVENEKTD